MMSQKKKRARTVSGCHWLYLLLFAVVVISRPGVLIADEPTDKDAQAASELDMAFRKSVQPFLPQYCVKCHGAKVQKADRQFDELPTSIDSDDVFVDYQDILDQLNLEAMPPEESKQPTAAARRQVIEVLTRQTRFYRESRGDTRTGAGAGAVLRRLNAREYRNTLRDLFQLDMTMFDPTVGFPRDQTTEHLDNVGDTLVTSGHQLAGYLAAAKHYELKLADDAGPDFKRVDLSDRRRGGLFGQASVLTVTANGIDTSPVVRGVWVLENIFGTPPSPPPDVEPLDPDVRGAKSIRDQLKKHRSNGSCNECHRKIDPLGLGMENLDHVGAWRIQYQKECLRALFQSHHNIT